MKCHIKHREFSLPCNQYADYLQAVTTPGTKAWIPGEGQNKNQKRKIEKEKWIIDNKTGGITCHPTTNQR